MVMLGAQVTVVLPVYASEAHGSLYASGRGVGCASLSGYEVAAYGSKDPGARGRGIHNIRECVENQQQRAPWRAREADRPSSHY